MDAFRQHAAFSRDVMGTSLVRRVLERASDKRLSCNKVCGIEDFSHPALVPWLRRIFSYEAGRYPGFPKGREYRKYWEVAMAVRALSDFGVLRKDAQVLGVGAGNEPTIFYLTSLVERVFATDLYLDPGVWGEFADTSMITQPGLHWPSHWNPRRLVVQHMNALDLQYEDSTFDAVFSSSSIEHFGSQEDVAKALDEIYRVLKPDGVFSVSTEYHIEGPAPGLPGCLMFDGDQLKEIFIDNRAWSLSTPLDESVSRRTLKGERDLEDVIKEFQQHFTKHGRLIPHELDFEEWPNVVLRSGPHLFTSVHLALVKQ